MEVEVSTSEKMAKNQLFSNKCTTTYEPLSSIWEGSDGELLEAMLSFYPTIFA